MTGTPFYPPELPPEPAPGQSANTGEKIRLSLIVLARIVRDCDNGSRITRSHGHITEARTLLTDLGIIEAGAEDRPKAEDEL